MSNHEFWDSYEKWQKQVWQEFVDGEFYQGQKREDIEICEDGTIHLSLFHYIKDCVTSWKDSKYYTE